MNPKSVLVATITTIGIASTAMADSASTNVNFSWPAAPGTGSTTATLNLPAVQSIDSIVLTLAHTWGSDLDIYVDAVGAGGIFDFDLMILEEGQPGSNGNFSMGVAVENGSLANVAQYTFVPSGGGAPDFVAPHSPAGTYDANAWLAGALAAGDYELNVNDAVGGDGGAIGTYTINYTPVPAVPSTGACCLPSGACTVLTALACAGAGGTYQGDGTACAGVVCPQPVPQDRVSATEKGSVLIYSKVELRYTAAGALIQDTFIDIANDFPADVRVKMYFINGDMRLTVGGVIVEPGWNVVNNVITLTANEPTYWSAATGLPKGVSPFTVLDPGALPGRPDPDVPGERHLRGFIVAFAIDSLTGCEIRWNHLKGDACIVRYDQNSAWEYNAWAFQAGVVAHGAQLPTCGALNFNGLEYAAAFDMLLMDFYAVGSAAFSIPGNLVTINTDLTLHPLSADFRQETTGLVQTKASFDVWNQNEVKFSGTDRCIRCWDQTLLGLYHFGLFGTGGNFPMPNNFLLANLQSDKGRARINGLASANVCPPSAALGFPNPSTIDPLLGVVAKQLTFNGATFAIAGTNLHGVGTQTDGVILYDPVAPPPPENSDTNWLDSIDKEINSATAAPRKR